MKKNTRRAARAWLVAAALLGLASAHADTQTHVSTFEYDTDGLLVRETANPDDLGACLQTRYAYDAHGNITSRSSSVCAGAAGLAIASAADARTATATYTSDGLFPATLANALGHSETREYHPAFGTLARLVGPNGLATTWEYDGFGRKIKETRADGTYTAWQYQMCPTGSQPGCLPLNGLPGAAWYVIESHHAADGSVAAPAVVRLLGSMGQELAHVTTAFGEGSSVARRTRYDFLGRIEAESIPRLGTATDQWITYEYDALGRVTKKSEPNADASGGMATTTYAYNGLVTTVTNAKGQKQTTQKDARGNTVKVTDHASQSIAYSYDARGNLIQTNAAGAITTMAYDHRGNKIAMNDPAMGAWTYSYNVFGELVQQRDSLSQASTLEYDKLGRLVKRTEPDLVSQWSYDQKFDGTACGAGVGKLCEAKADNGYLRTHTYDSLGRPSSTATTLESSATAQTFAWSYDNASRVAAQSWPTGYQLRFAYNSRGYLTRAASGTVGTANGSEIDILARNARGQITQYRQGGVITTVNTHDAATGLLKAIEATTTGQAAGNLINHSYGYDSLGNLASRIDSGTGTQESFVYDNINRLTQYTLLGGAVSPPKVVETRYDARGNLSYKSDVGTYSYDSARRDRLKSIAKTTASGAQVAVTGTRAITYTWDDALAGAQTIGTTKVGNGNLQLMVSLDAANGRNLYTQQSYTSFNMPSQIARGAMNGTAQGPATHTLSFVYGPEHQRVKQTVTGGEQAGTTWYLNGEDSLNLGYEKTVLANGLTEHKHYLTAAGITYATYTSRSGTLGGKAAQEVNYLHGDHLGSVAAVSSRTGTLIERLAYDPWGKRRNTDGIADPTDVIQASTGNRGFTLHEHLEEVALTHMNGRIYDPYIGRFLTADPYIVEPDNLQNFNRYAYVENNPLSFTDPTGYCTAWDPTTNTCYAYQPDLWEALGIPQCGSSGWPCWRAGDDWYGGGVPIGPGLPPIVAPPVIAPTPIGMVIMPSLAAPLSQPSTAELARQIDKAAKDVANSNLIQTMSDTIVKAAQEAMTRVMPFMGLAQMALQTWMSSNETSNVGADSPSNTPDPASGSDPDRGDLTKAGRAQQKHGDRAGSAFDPASGTPQDKNTQGQRTLDRIVNSPDRVDRPNRHGGIDILESPGGRGARFGPDGKFTGFLEP